MATAYTDQVQKVYIAYYGRAADPVGLAYWAAKVEANGLDGIMASFGASAEATTLYGSLTNTAKVNALYQQSFGRDADFAGLMYYAGQLTAGTMTAATIAQNIFDGASGDDATILTNKLIVAKAYTAAVDTAGEVVAYSGTVAAASARALLTTVDAATVTAGFDVATSVASIVAVASATPAVAGTTTALTATTDTFTGGAGNDIYNGVIQKAGATGSTAAPGDSISGGAGVDTLAISIAGAATAHYTLSALSTTDVEKVLLSNFDTSTTKNNTVDTALMTGLTHVGLSASSVEGDSIFENINNIVTGEMKNGAGNLTTTYTTAVVAGTADAMTLNVSNLTGTGSTFTGDGIENLTIDGSLVKSTMADVVGSALKTVTITGDQDLTVTASIDFAASGDAAAIDGTIDASALTGKLNVTASSAETVKIIGGSANDTINLAGELTKYDNIDGGAGIDTVSITGHDGTANLVLSTMTLTNVETLDVTGTANKNTQISIDGTSITTVINRENATSAKNVDVTNMEEGDTLTLVQINGGNTGDVTGAFKDATGTADSMNFEIQSLSGAGSEIIDSITAVAIETINLNSVPSTTTATVTTDIAVVTDQTYSAATSIVVTGDTNLTMSNAMTAANLSTVDASAFTGDFKMTAHVKDLTITGGSGNDVFTMATTLTAADVIDGGSNTGSTGKDSVVATINDLGTTATHAALSIANVETITLNTATAASFISGTGITGTTTIVIENDQNVTLSNLSTDTTIQLAEVGGALDDYTGSLTASLADETGAADNLTIAMSAQATDNGINGTLVTNAALETLTLKASTNTATTNDVTLDVTKVKSGTIALTKGDASEAMTLGTLSATTTVVDGSAFDGVLEVTASATGTAITVKTGAVANAIIGGAGADTVTLGALGADDAAGGAGTDTLNATVKTSVTEATTAFENVNYTVGNSVQVTVTGANGAGMDVATNAKLLGGNALTTYAGDFVSPANLVSLDMSGYNGKSTALTFAASQLASTMDIIGSPGADTITATTANDNAAVKSMSGVETLVINAAGGATTFDFSKTSGVTKVKTDDDGTARNVTMTDIATGTKVEVTTGIADSGIIIDMADRTALDNAITMTVGTTVDAVDLDVPDVETVNLINKTGASSVDLAGLAMTTAGKTSTLNVTGDKALTISALHGDVTVLDASGMGTGGSVIQTGRSATAASTYTGSVGDDTFIMMNKSDAIIASTGTDTLDINYAAVLGGISVDLSSATDQVDTYNGSANSVAQLGFENVDVSGYTGSFGSELTAAAAGSTLTGTLVADNLNFGAGSDIAVINDSTADSITNYTKGTDKINISLSALEAAGGTGIDAAAVDFMEAHDGNALTAGDTVTVKELPTGSDTAVADASNVFIMLTTSLDDTDAVEAALEDTGTHEMVITADVVADNDAFFVLYTDGTDTFVAAVHATAAQNAVNMGVGELTAVNIAKLVGVTDIAAGDWTAANFAFIA